MKSEKRIPTIIGVIILIICIVIGVYYTNFRTTLGSKASGDCSPINPQVTNITHNSADISFVTTSLCSMALSINNQIVQDIKLQTTNTTNDSSSIHYYQIKYLQESTDYTYSLIVNNESITNNNFTFKTSIKPNSTIPSSNLAWGRILNPDMQTTANAIVYLNIPGAAPLSSFVTTNGNWSVSLASSFNAEKNDWFTPPAIPVEEDIVVIAADSSTTQVSNNTGLNNPVPDIILGQNSLVVSTGRQNESTGQLDNITPVQTRKVLDITNPKNGETLTVSEPDFFGTAPINSSVIIEVHSPLAINGETQSDVSGTWHWSPPENLTPGEHTITVKTQNPSTGLWEVVTRNFIVQAADTENPSYEASGSAGRVTQAPTPTVVVVVPTATIAPVINTIIPTVRAARPSTTSAPPVTGNSLPTIIIVSMSVIFFIISLKFIR